MCGFTGFVDFCCSQTSDALHQQASAMAATLAHRGPDDNQTWADAEVGIALGFRRLAIVDLSAEGRQPMVSADQRFVLVFNGMIYNYRELRGRLEGLGTTFRGSSDTEVLLEAIAEWGVEEALCLANGMFAVAAWDRRERRLSLARDRFGEKPLYYSRTANGFLFGSELRALQANDQFEPGVDRDAVGLLMKYGYIPAPYSIFDSVKKLEPGSVLVLDVENASVSEPHRYWSALDEAVKGSQEISSASDGEAVEQLKDLLTDAVGLRMAADVPLGAFLSGGVDSSAVVALMQRQSSSQVRTFTIGSDDLGFDESAHAAEVARHLGTSHTELFVDERQLLDIVAELPGIYDEPFADSSQIPMVAVSRLARTEVTVALSGDGGDEVFGGYNRHLTLEPLWNRAGVLPSPVRRVAAGAIGLLPPAAWTRTAGLVPESRRPRDPAMKAAKITSVLGSTSAAAAYQKLTTQWSNIESLVPAGAHGTTLLERPDLWPSLPSITDQMMAIDAVTYLPGDILTKVDRASMSASLEARVPLLDHRVYEFATRLPMHQKIRNGVGKWALREVLFDEVPRELIERPKTGFTIPLATWLRGPLRDWAEELLAPSRLDASGFVNPTIVGQVWAEHLSGRSNRESELWTVLMLESWLENQTVKQVTS